MKAEILAATLTVHVKKEMVQNKISMLDYWQCYIAVGAPFCAVSSLSGNMVLSVLTSPSTSYALYI